MADGQAAGIGAVHSQHSANPEIDPSSISAIGAIQSEIEQTHRADAQIGAPGSIQAAASKIEDADAQASGIGAIQASGGKLLAFDAQASGVGALQAAYSVDHASDAQLAGVMGIQAAYFRGESRSIAAIASVQAEVTQSLRDGGPGIAAGLGSIQAQTDTSRFLVAQLAMPGAIQTSYRRLHGDDRDCEPGAQSSRVCEPGDAADRNCVPVE